jgi:hypothetical protein
LDEGAIFKVYCELKVQRYRNCYQREYSVSKLLINYTIMHLGVFHVSRVGDRMRMEGMGRRKDMYSVLGLYMNSFLGCC